MSPIQWILLKTSTTINYERRRKDHHTFYYLNCLLWKDSRHITHCLAPILLINWIYLNSRYLFGFSHEPKYGTNDFLLFYVIEKFTIKVIPITFCSKPILFNELTLNVKNAHAILEMTILFSLNRTNGWQFFYQLTSQIITWTKHPCISLKVFCCPSKRVLGLQNTHCWNVIIHFSWTCQTSNI